MGFLTRNSEHFVVVPSLNLAYGRVPKVANSMLKRQVARAAGIEDQFNEVFSRDRDWRTKAPVAYLVTAAELKRRWPEAFVFAFVRDPLSRLGSCYRSKISGAKRFSDAFRREGLTPDTTFPEFVAHVERRRDWRCNVHYRPQAAILTHRGEVVPDFIGKFETIREDWKRLSDLLEGRGSPRLPPLPQRNHKRPVVAPDDFFEGDEALAARARARYSEDYRLFYPEQA